MSVSIKESIKRLYDLQQEKKRFDEYYNEVKKKEQLNVSNYMFSNLGKNENSFEMTLDSGFGYYENPVDLKVTKVRTKKVLWYIDKLKKKMSKETFKKVILKKYTINDMKGLTSYLKECGVDPKEFKKFIEVQEELNEPELERLYETGKIDASEIEGCFTVNMGEPYIRITEVKEKCD